MNLEKTRQILEQAENALILMHTSPDMDCIGSAYALWLDFSRRGIPAVIGIEAPLPRRYTFLIPQKDLESAFQEKNQILVQNFDLVVCVDTGDPKLLGEFASLVQNRKVLVIDHHATFLNYGTWNFNQNQSSSTCEMIYDLLEPEISEKTAQVLYAGISYDTGNFRYSVKGSVMKKAGILIDKFEINTENIYFNLFENESLARKTLEARIISSIQTYAGGEMVISFLKEAFKRDLVLDESDTSDLVRVGHSLAGCLFSVFVKEKDLGVSLSLRSRTDFDVSEIAALFGGGGHRKASGIRLKNTSLAQTEKEILPKIIQAYEQWRQK